LRVVHIWGWAGKISLGKSGKTQDLTQADREVTCDNAAGPSARRTGAFPPGTSTIKQSSTVIYFFSTSRTSEDRLP